jgi:hypothetical protein
MGRWRLPETPVTASAVAPGTGPGICNPPERWKKGVRMRLVGNEEYSEQVDKIAKRWNLDSIETRKILDEMMAWSSQYAEELCEITHAGIGADNALWVAAKTDADEGFVWFATSGGDTEESSYDEDMASIMGVEWENFREAMDGSEL